MSEDELNKTEDASEAGDRNASMTVDASTLSSEEADFARQMGFGLEDEEEEPPKAAKPKPAPAQKAKPAKKKAKAKPAAEEPAEPRAEEEEEEEANAKAEPAKEDTPEPKSSDSDTDSEDSDEEADEDESDVEEEAEKLEEAVEEATESVATSADDETLSSSESDSKDEPEEEDTESSQDDFEEIHPRADSDGMQATLEARAEEVLKRDPRPATSAASVGVPKIDTSAFETQIASLREDVGSAEKISIALRTQLTERDSELEIMRTAAGSESSLSAKEEKENEELRTEVEALSIERDQLIDQLAVTSGQVVQFRNHSEKLEASLRAARGALTPLPEGERALRAEVIGLRGRIEESREEHLALTTKLSQGATELAIARARVEDRQHEVNCHVELVEELEERMVLNDEKLANAVARHRELLALSTRLQADNNELRSAQGALEETLQARDLEILAREEHLNVTRQGLSARDTQLVDVNERLDLANQRADAQEADLARGAIDHDLLIEKIEHRESRIATLTETLARIEEAMGHPIPVPDSAAREMPQAEWTRPTLAQDISLKPKPRVRPSARIASPSDAARVTDSEESEETDLTPRDFTETEAGVVPESAVATNDSVSSEPQQAVSTESKQVETSSETSDQKTASDDTREDQTESIPAEPIITVQPRLPAILSTWRDRRFNEIIEGTQSTSVQRFLAERLQKHLGDPGPEYVFLRSLGGSLDDAEVHFIQSLRDLGVTGIRMEVLDSDLIQADARRHKIELAGLGEIIDVTVGDLDQWDANAPCHAIFLSDALHSQPNVTQFLEHIAPSLADGALLLFLDRIASGPLQLSASALNRLEELWAVLPESLATAEGLSIVPHRGDDGGFPRSATDPAGELLARLSPIVMAGFGHLADLVVGPTRGRALSVEDDEAMQLLESIMTIDDSRALTENLAPRHGLAVFARGSAGRTEILGQEWPSEPVEKEFKP